jgi:ABC-type bacteriocin/lantibiotic exporter with double-glycine peptidase domain
MLQLTAVECGAACLAMILRYHGRETSIAECRERCGLGRDGVTARTLAEVARSYGLRVTAYSLDPADLRSLPLPAIVHWDFNHFVIVERWAPSWVSIVDPAGGRRRVSAAEFDASFTGVALALEPGAHFQTGAMASRRGLEPAGRSMEPARESLFAFLLRLVARIPGALIQILGASLLLQLLGLALPVLTQVLVDRVLPFHMTSVVAILPLGLALLLLTQLVLGYLRAALLVYLQGRLDSQMMLGFVEHLLSLPFAFFQQRSSGDLLMRLTGNTMIREILSNQTISVVLDGAFVFGYLVVLWVRAPLFGLLALGVGLLQSALLLGTARLMHRLNQRDLAAQAEAQSYLVEALKGIATLKASGAEDRAFDRWSNLFRKELNVSLQQSQLSAVVEMTTSAVRTFAPLLLLWAGATQVLNGSMSLGTMLALNALATAFLTPLASLAATAQRLQLLRAYYERLADVLEAEPEQRLETLQTAPRFSGRIELRNVSFRHDPNAPLAVRDISLAIEPGQKVALVGATGSGKSTLAMLLLGLYTPNSGKILYDGRPLQSMRYATVRRQFGAVLQETFLFAGSIRQNIAFNDPALSLDQVVEAARLAGIHESVIRLPMGYETLVAEGGSALSGGQRQCLAIARALAHRPAIVLLDEATSHLDVLTEALVDYNLSRLQCTRIVIAHRLSTIRNADVILVLDQGAVVEQGSHRELLELGGRYAALVRQQGVGVDAADDSSTAGGVCNHGDGPPAVETGRVVPVERNSVTSEATISLFRTCIGCGHTLRGPFCTMCGAPAGPVAPGHGWPSRSSVTCARCGHSVRRRFCTQCGEDTASRRNRVS